MEIRFAQNNREQIIDLLQSLKLPVADLPANLEKFYIILDSQTLAGVIGLEVFEGHGLLRSLAVKPDYQGRGIAGDLVAEVESLAARLHLTDLYLITETAAGYFARIGYQQLERTDVAKPVQQSSQFKLVCPASAVIMRKTILNH